VTFEAIDIDQHFLEPKSMWKEFLPTKFRDQAPRFVVDSLGIQREVVGGVTLPRLPLIPIPRANPHVPTVADAGTHYGLEEDRVAAGSDPYKRLEFLDKEGVRAAVIYPTAGLHFGAMSNTNVELVVALCRAYNDWASEYCKVAPDRLFAPAMVPQIDVAETILETRRAVEELGMLGVTMRPNPIGRTVEDPAWEPLWELLNDLEAPLAFHEGGQVPPAGNGRSPQFGSDRTDNFIYLHMMSHPFEMMAAMLSMIGGGILDRYPKLRVFFVEAGCGWVPFWLHRMEQRAHFASPYEGMQLELRPTEYFQRQCFVSADADEDAVLAAFVSCLGSDNVCWSSDFPHPDHVWGGLVEEFSQRTNLTDETKVKVLAANAARAYGL
jgi:uncharacterized protein